ncbi:hypothetical protein BGZ57DRAFT_881273 [Hyaloscypha finlandica]|nr:hypothetical protein BGZ57DRAFT_881273 [Hyaloscypha finlandica]
MKLTAYITAAVGILGICHAQTDRFGHLLNLPPDLDDLYFKLDKFLGSRILSLVLVCWRPILWDSKPGCIQERGLLFLRKRRRLGSNGCFLQNSGLHQPTVSIL